MIITELSKRKQDVLSAIIKAYIETGEPIGSKILTSLIENAPSPATLRNEMNELCSLGFLAQPHTSAGRIPTSLGYSLYVNNLMSETFLGESAKSYINSSFSLEGDEAERLPRAAAKALSELSGLPAISSYIVRENVYLKQVQLLPLSRKTVALLTVFSDGRTKSTLVRLAPNIEAEAINRFLQLIREKLLRKPLYEFSKAKLQSTLASFGIDFLDAAPLVTAIFDMADESSGSQINLSGGEALYNFCSDTEARQIVALTERNDVLLSTLEADDKETSIIFGNETGLCELKNKVIVASKYYCNNNYCGKIGVIGPDRLAYEQIIPSTKYTAERLTSLITQTVNDMED